MTSASTAGPVRADWHLITCEYPPQLGGVSDYVRLIAAELKARGGDVQVWAPGRAFADSSPAITPEGVTLRRSFGAFRPGDLRRVGHALDSYPAPRRLFVQWVPHGYGYRSLNVAFCLWLWWRARAKRDVVELMVHECFLPFTAGRWRANVVALGQRAMMAILLRTAARIWYSTPAWEPKLRPLTFGRRVPFGWLPLPSTVPLEADAGIVAALRSRYAPAPRRLVGHMGTFGREQRELLLGILPGLCNRVGECDVLLMGPGGEALRDALIARDPALADRIRATGPIPATELSNYIAACDVMLQPYADGVTTRRTSFMAGLAIGVPTVTTLGFLSEAFWKETGAALFTEADDASAMVEGIRALLSDRDVRDRVARGARRLYEDRFAIRHIADALTGAVTRS